MSQNTRNKYEIEGDVVKVDPPKHLSDNFVIARVVLKIYKDRYLEDVPFDFINRFSEYTRDIEVGSRVMITFQISGREKTNKNNETYNIPSLQGLNITKL